MLVVTLGSIFGEKRQNLTGKCFEQHRRGRPPLLQLQNTSLQKQKKKEKERNLDFDPVPVPWRSVLQLCAFGGDAWLLKLSEAPVGHHEEKTPTKLRLIDQCVSSRGTVQSQTGGPLLPQCLPLLMPLAPICCSCPVSIFRRVCLREERSAPSAVQCASRDAGGPRRDGADTGRHCCHAAFF